MRKTGDTSFVFEELVIDLEEGIFLPNGAANQLRRDALNALQCLMLEKYHRKPIFDSGLPERQKLGANVNHKEQTRNIASVENRAQLEAVLQREWITTVYIDWNTYSKTGLTIELRKDIHKISTAGKESFLVLPAISRNKTMSYLYSIVN